MENSTEKTDTTIEKINSLRKSITSKMDVLTYKGKRNKTGATIAQTCIIVFSVATPILIGWKTGADWKPENIALLVNLALICSAVTAGGNMLFNFFDYKELWVEYKNAKNELLLLLSELDYLESSGTENIKPEQVDAIFQKYLAICLEIGRNYRRIRSTKDTAETPT
jgi:hypothetical protein